MLSAMKQLEARVAALEGENKQAKQEAATARAEASALRQRIAVRPPSSGTARTVGESTANLAALPPGTYAMATKAPVLTARPIPSWGGLYAGAAFGIASLGPQVAEHQVNTDITTTVFGGGSTTFSNDTSTFNGNESGRSVGAVANLFLGYNFVVSPNFLLGGQVEGGVTNIHVNLRGAGTDTAVTTQINTPGTTSTFTSVQNETFTDSISNRWLVSVLGRGGYVLSPSDLLYVIGGWTYGRFEFGQSFGLNGGTVGGGWEHMVAPGWTLKTEGRYTKFQSKTIGTEFTNALTSSGPGFTQTGTTSNVGSNRVSADMWSVTVGVSHYFN
jgi:opacity protein-like surface antigen